MSLVLNVDILGEYKQLTAATKGAQTQLTNLNKRTQKISSSINSAFAAIGIGLSFKVIANELEEASKAAIEDAKSQKILALAMENTGKATADQVAQAEKAINKMQFQAGVADDKLRPAYQKLFIATGNVTQSNRLLQIAMDASAATGKDLDAVSQAMAKSLAGSDTALVKLIPSLKGAKDPIGELEKAFKGAATEAANTDPYQRMQVIMEDLQEQIGSALLPVLEEFSTWLQTPEGQKKLGQIIALAKDIIARFTEMAKWVLDNKDWLLPMVAAIGGVAAAWNGVTTAIQAATAASEFFAGVGAVLGGGAALGAGATAVLGGSAAGGYLTGQAQGETAQIYQGALGIGKSTTSTAKKTPAQITQINIKGTQSAQQIAYALNKQYKASGSSTIIRGGR